jgi:hypothetical protein
MDVRALRDHEVTDGVDAERTVDRMVAGTRRSGDGEKVTRLSRTSRRSVVHDHVPIVGGRKVERLEDDGAERR